MTALTLTDFLLARIAEDEAGAEFRHDQTCGLVTHPNWSGCNCDRRDAARVLAECEAKRRIVKRCSSVDYAMPSTHLAHGILAELAAAYADHPDYRDEWRP